MNIKKIISATLLFFVATSFSHAKSESETVQETVNHFLSTVNSKTTHQNFWAEDLIYTSSSGERFGKANIIDGMKEDNNDSKEQSLYSADELNVNFYNGTAIVTFKLIYEKDKTQTISYFNTGVLVKRDNRWQAVTWQATKIPNESKIAE